MHNIKEIRNNIEGFKESLQKALVSLEIGFSGLDRILHLNKNELEKNLKKNIPNKILLVAEAIRKKIHIKKKKKKFQNLKIKLYLKNLRLSQ